MAKGFFPYNRKKNAKHPIDSNKSISLALPKHCFTVDHEGLFEFRDHQNQ